MNPRRHIQTLCHALLKKQSVATNYISCNESKDCCSSDPHQTWLVSRMSYAFLPSNITSRYGICYTLNESVELERGLVSSEEHFLLWQRTQLPFPVSMGQLTTVYNSSCRESDALFWLLQTPATHMVKRNTCRHNTHTHTQKKKQNLKDKVRIYPVFDLSQCLKKNHKGRMEVSCSDRCFH